MDYPLKMADQLRPQLQSLRKKRGLTQAQLGQAIGVTQARIVEIEANPGVVNLQQIMQILNALGSGLVIRETGDGASENHPGEDTAATATQADGKTRQRTRQGRW